MNMLTTATEITYLDSLFRISLRLFLACIYFFSSNVLISIPLPLTRITFYQKAAREAEFESEMGYGRITFL